MAHLPDAFLEQQGKGRPKGKLNKITEEYLAFGQSVLDSQEWRESAKARMVAGEADHLETYFAHRIHGKPKEIVELQSLVPLFALPVGAFVAVTDGDEPLELPAPSNEVKS
jgi:hypothetical protein